MLRWRPLLLSFAAVPILAVGMSGLGAASLVGMLHIPRRIPTISPTAQVVQMSARDQAVMKASWEPASKVARCVFVQHGLGGTRDRADRFTDALLAHGYSVLAPDSRAHGESGGELVTYGLLEQYDTLDWVKWLRERGCTEIFGLGESLGSSVLILAAALEDQPFQAIVADCAFADLMEVAEYRAQTQLHLPGLIGKLALTGGVAYARMAYGLDFASVSPLDSIARTRTPVLLIHGQQDTRTPPAQSQKLAAASSQTELWLVPGARHVGSFRVAREEYMRRTLDWFEKHSRTIVNP